MPSHVAVTDPHFWTSSNHSLPAVKWPKGVADTTCPVEHLLASRQPCYQRDLFIYLSLRLHSKVSTLSESFTLITECPDARTARVHETGGRPPSRV